MIIFKVMEVKGTERSWKKYQYFSIDSERIRGIQKNSTVKILKLFLEELLSD